MRQFSVFFTVLSIFLLSVLAAPVPSDQALDKRQGSGRGTWFYDYTAESACGTWNSATETIVAISSSIFDSGAHCGQSIWITSNGITKSATVGDECPSCGAGDLDMSQGLFELFDPLSVGVLSITWGWS